MDKNSALKKLKDFELLNRIKHIDLVDVLTENDFIKLDPIVSFMSVIMGAMIFTVFFTGILSILFPNAEVSWLEASFILSVPIVSSVAFLTLMIRKDSNKKEKMSRYFLEKFQGLYYINDVGNIIKYYDKVCFLENEKKKELMDDEDFIKTCLHELKLNNSEFMEHQDTILELAKPMTNKKIKKEENRKSMERMHKALFEKDEKINEKESFKIVEID